MKELGKMVGLTESAISLYENGKRQPDGEMLVKLSDILGVTTDMLLGLEDQQTKKATTFSGDGLSDKDQALLTWFRSLPKEKQQAILTAQDAPGGLV